jgi:hypothetical protein
MTAEQSIAVQLGALFEALSRDHAGRIRVEDLLSAAAAACGEACITAAGEFDPEDHAFTPGAAVLSDKINGILTGEARDWRAAGDSVFGIIHAGALENGYRTEDFPDIGDPIARYVESLGDRDPADWGRVKLSVPDDNLPSVQPLRRAYELRPHVRQVLGSGNVARADWPRVCAAALVVELGRARAAIEPGLAVRIVLETVNGMAKMAPMTDRHTEQAHDLHAPPGGAVH